jgi:hypothetical protein
VPFQGESLPAVVDEMKAARRVIPSTAILALPSDADCTVDAKGGPTAQMILDIISEATILHLASHGTQARISICYEGSLY